MLRRGFRSPARPSTGLPSWADRAPQIVPDLFRSGLSEGRQRLSQNLVGRSGLREYYDPFTGKGMGTVSFAWSTLAIEIAAPDPRAGSSYLEP